MKTYAKPQILATSKAASSILGQQSKSGNEMLDIKGPVQRSTPAAYPADE
jgi:hypothetical protein